MTDKQIVETFRNLQEYCASKRDCEDCRFFYLKNGCCGYCQLEEIAWMLAVRPEYWDIGEIERIIND